MANRGVRTSPVVLNLIFILYEIQTFSLCSFQGTGVEFAAPTSRRVFRPSKGLYYQIQSRFREKRNELSLRNTSSSWALTAVCSRPWGVIIPNLFKIATGRYSSVTSPKRAANGSPGQRFRGSVAGGVKDLFSVFRLLSAAGTPKFQHP
jgi:hypothetical protein